MEVKMEVFPKGPPSPAEGRCAYVLSTRYQQDSLQGSLHPLFLVHTFISFFVKGRKNVALENLDPSIIFSSFKTKSKVKEML